MKTDVAFRAAQEFMMSFDCCEDEKLMVFGWVQIGSRCFYKCGGKRVLIWLECSFFFVNWICISLALNFSLYQSFSGWKKIAKSNRIFAIVFIQLLHLNWISFDFNAGAKWFRSMKLVAIHKEKRNENYFFFVHKSYEFYKRNNSTENELQKLQRKKVCWPWQRLHWKNALKCKQNGKRMGWQDKKWAKETIKYRTNLEICVKCNLL